MRQNLSEIKEAIKNCLERRVYGFIEVTHLVCADDTKICSYYVRYGTNEKMVRYLELTVQEYGKKQKVFWYVTNGIGISVDELRDITKAVEGVTTSK